MRQFVNYASREGGATLEVRCFALTGGEIFQLVKLLRQMDFIFDSINEDSLQAKLESSYDIVFSTMMQLGELGFAWKEGE